MRTVILLTALLDLVSSNSWPRGWCDTKLLADNQLSLPNVLSQNAKKADLGGPRHDLPTPEIIAMEGYPVETHLVTTEDGYILSMRRYGLTTNVKSLNMFI